MNRYLAQAQYKKAQDKGAQSISDVVFHSQLRVRFTPLVHPLSRNPLAQHAADLERRQNEQESTKLLGTPVSYGGVIQAWLPRGV